MAKSQPEQRLVVHGPLDRCLGVVVPTPSTSGLGFVDYFVCVFDWEFCNQGNWTVKLELMKEVSTCNPFADNPTEHDFDLCDDKTIDIINTINWLTWPLRY